jgi:hypothetical protein
VIRRGPVGLVAEPLASGVNAGRTRSLAVERHRSQSRDATRDAPSRRPRRTMSSSVADGGID